MSSAVLDLDSGAPPVDTVTVTLVNNYHTPADKYLSVTSKLHPLVVISDEIVSTKVYF